MKVPTRTVNGDQDMFVVSVLLQTKIYRYTSPLYVYKTTFSGKLSLHEDDEEIYGLISYRRLQGKIGSELLLKQLVTMEVIQWMTSWNTFKDEFENEKNMLGGSLGNRAAEALRQRVIEHVITSLLSQSITEGLPWRDLLSCFVSLFR
ncbi:unnamed protein product [Camellia sinensis]